MTTENPRDKNGRAPRGPNTTKTRGTKYAGRLTGPQQQALLDLFVTRYRGREGSPGHGLSDKQISERMGVGLRTIARYKALFIERDPDLAEVIRGRQVDSIDHIVSNLNLGPQLQDEPPTPPRPSEALKGILTINEMLEILTELATAGPPQYRVQAVKLFDELQAVHRPIETFGPPAPLTESEREDRLVTILDVCARATADAAYRRAYGKEPPPMDPQEGPEGPEEAAELQDNPYSTQVDTRT